MVSELSFHKEVGAQMLVIEDLRTVRMWSCTMRI